MGEGSWEPGHTGGETGDIAWVGTVVATQANYYRVQLDQPAESLIVEVPPQRDWLCIRRSRLKKIGQRVMVGDRVRLEEPDWQGQRAAIAEVFPRRSEMDRPPVANVNQILLIFALAEPDLDPHLLTRFLVKAESLQMSICLGLSKSDLVSEAVRQAWSDRLRAWGYHPILFSVTQTDGLEQLLPYLRHQTTVICGPSGVGKSSLINALIPDLELRVGEVSGKLGKGRHTTRHVELFELQGGGILADSPGFNQPELTCETPELAHCFPEIRQLLSVGTCQFNDCLHGEEPGCKVRGHWERYGDYLTLLAEVQALQQMREQSRGAEASLKRKFKGDGSVTYEPRLAQKKYRQTSRRSQHQSLESMTHPQHFRDLEDFEDVDLSH